MAQRNCGSCTVPNDGMPSTDELEGAEAGDRVEAEEDQRADAGGEQARDEHDADHGSGQAGDLHEQEGAEDR